MTGPKLRLEGPASVPENTVHNTVGLEPLLTAERVASILGVRPKRVYELGIPSVRLSARCLRWRRTAVESWISERSSAA